MKTGPKPYKRLCGIYKIYFKSDPEFFYIGSSENIHYRVKQHLGKLTMSNSAHTLLQSYFTKFGIENFAYTIVRLCKKWQLEYFEQYYISELNPPLNSFKFSGIAKNNGKKAQKEAMKDMLNDNDVTVHYDYKIVKFTDDEFMQFKIIPLNVL